MCSAEDGRTALCYTVEARQRPAAELLLAAQARLDLVPPHLLQQLGVEEELSDARAASSKAATASAASTSALKAATAERDAAQRTAADAECTAADAERSAAAARQKAEAAQGEAVALQHKLQVAEEAAAQLREEAAGLRVQHEAEAQRAGELQSALDAAAAQQAAAERSFSEQAAALELQALEAAAAADKEQRGLQVQVAVLRRHLVHQQQECARLRAALDKELRKGFWARLCGGSSKARVAPEAEDEWGSDAAEETPAMPAQQPVATELPAAGNSWSPPHAQAFPAAAVHCSPAAEDAARATDGGDMLPELSAVSASADMEQEAPAFDEPLGEAAANEPAADSEALGSGAGGAVAKGGPASAPTLLPEDVFTAASWKAQAGGVPGAAEGSGAEASSSDGMGANYMGAEAGGEAASIPAFRPEPLDPA
ncbi:hypothetical protein C2E21_8629 [Chlorella sorokiniana]|uniref:Uncharacterized protein n=1 Tax=Chlorella sorokiniana TaxID=3076 RepID=A0A2P6TE59_CHLSO|nr:hypothetical protein C2E21_8629 [Chlorella sorokiniana]|eukprot:PRW20930.1 hypothetical protein C2E21_8629 [Chlorella sorokiniana]